MERVCDCFGRWWFDETGEFGLWELANEAVISIPGFEWCRWLDQGWWGLAIPITVTILRGVQSAALARW